MIFTIGGLHPESGGPARSVPALCQELARAGVAVELVTLDAGGPPARDIQQQLENVRLHVVSCHGSFCRRLWWTPNFSARLRERCAADDGTVLHDNGLWMPTNHAAAKAARELGRPLMITPRGMLTPWALNFKKWKKKLAWWLFQARDLRSARVLQATSTEEAQEFRALGLRQPIAVVPNGVFLPSQGASATTKERGRTALFLSRIHPKKGLLNLVEAWSRLRPAGWRVVIAGPDEDGHRAEVEAAAGAAGLAQQFEFVGPVGNEAKWQLYQQADLFVLPTFSENFGMVVAEALAAGLPVITTKGTPWQELETRRCGWWVDIGTEPLTAALREAVGLTDAERREMGFRGRRLVEENYSWPTIARRMIGVYEWILGIGPRPGSIV